ncbi:uncharacterized protein B0J16DRAFT_331449 [Fusarium flagelliforme]|uniref:uncharacterized protein n=1 Tax=Fusarium flagelliforme TaxID=2675880 RepID=UPI001E8EC743|nr:uncharacterized protein B0J16DRAFT_331449 [Fusarium flagelliforme]KAH7198980.1 hypothetical protein B0J16DRAFT_331449 [Fusarium flagelliforme]
MNLFLQLMIPCFSTIVAKLCERINIVRLQGTHVNEDIPIQAEHHSRRMTNEVCPSLNINPKACRRNTWRRSSVEDAITDLAVIKAKLKPS